MSQKFTVFNAPQNLNRKKLLEKELNEYKRQVYKILSRAQWLSDQLQLARTKKGVVA